MATVSAWHRVSTPERRIMKDLMIGDVRIDPGTKTQFILRIGTRLDGSPLGVPVMVVRGVADGPTLCVDAAVHGSEYEPIVGIISLVKHVKPEELTGTLIAVPALNVQAFEMMRRVSPVDYLDHDMNRVYPGKADGYITQRLAHVHVQQVISQADYGVSFHSGGAGLQWFPFVIVGGAEGSLELAKSMGVGWEVIGEWGGAFRGTVDSAYTERGIPSIVGEFGGPGRQLPREFAEGAKLVTDGLRNMMKNLGILPGEPVYPAEWFMVKQIALRPDHGGLIAWEPQCGFRYHAKAGETLARMVDLFGCEVERVDAPTDGILSSMRLYASAYPGHSLAHFGQIVDVLQR
jgi:predicted deacylase